MTPTLLPPRRRLLFLLPFPPRLDATHGGARAITHIVTTLASRHEVALLYLRGHEEAPIDSRVTAHCAWTEEVPREAGRGLLQRVAHRARIEGARLRGHPGWAAQWGAGPFGARVEAAVRRWRPDVVHMEYHVMGQFAGAARRGAARGRPTSTSVGATDGDAAGTGPVLVLTAYEPAAEAARELARGAAGHAVVRAQIDVARWTRFERRTLASADAGIVFTERDARALQPLAGDTPLFTIPLGVPLPATPLDATGGEPRELLFVGNFRHPPNLLAARCLLEEIAPWVWEREPDTRVTIVGAYPPPELTAQAGSRVRVTGEVEDVTPYLDRATVVIAPIFTGGGMRVKVLEALAAGKAVVATPRAVEGLGLTDGVQLRIADNAVGLAQAAVALLQDEALRASLARGARAWACAALGAEALVARYDAVYARLLR